MSDIARLESDNANVRNIFPAINEDDDNPFGGNITLEDIVCQSQEVTKKNLDLYVRES